AEPESLRRRRYARRRGAAARARRVLRLDPQDAEPPALGRPDLDEPFFRRAQAEGQHSGVGVAVSGLERPEARARRVRRDDDRVGGPARCRVACGRPRLVFGRGQTRRHQAQMGAGRAHVQSRHAPSRTGALHADAGRRQAARHRFFAGAGVTRMSDVTTLEQEIGNAIAAATEEAALEAVRVAALGKSGSISVLLKTLGAMTPDERKVQGPLINGLKERVTAALAARREALKGAALDARLNTETVDVTLPV